MVNSPSTQTSCGRINIALLVKRESYTTGMRRVKGESKMLCIQSPQRRSTMSSHLTVVGGWTKIGNETAKSEGQRCSYFGTQCVAGCNPVALQQRPYLPSITCVDIYGQSYLSLLSSRASSQVRSDQMGGCGPSNTSSVTPFPARAWEGPSLLIRPQNPPQQPQPLLDPCTLMVQ